MARSEVGAALLDGTESRPWPLYRRENKWGFVHCKGFLRLNVGPVTASCEHGDGTWVSVHCGELVAMLKLWNFTRSDTLSIRPTPGIYLRLALSGILSVPARMLCLSCH
jgi:hypothetical protein